MDFLKRFGRNRGALIGLVLLLVLIGFALIAPYLYPQNPWRTVARPFLPPFSIDRFPLGTDTLGRDIAAGLIHGARVSLAIGVTSTIVALLIGIPLGAIAGYRGGLIDDALMRFTEFFQTIPSFALAIVLIAIMQPTLGSIVLAIGIVSWPPVALVGAGRGRLLDAWWISFFPGIAIFLSVLALNLAGEGLNDALNPRLARGRH